MRDRAQRDIDGNPEFGVWSIMLIADLRTRSERDRRNRKGNAGRPAKPPTSGYPLEKEQASW